MTPEPTDSRNGFVLTERDVLVFRGCRRYGCPACGFKTPWVKNGEELRQWSESHQCSTVALQ